MSAQLVWFKRDLRVADHAPLINAAKAGPVLCLYILEPALWQQPDAARQHFHFTLECLRDLYTALRKHGLTLQIHVGEATDVLDDLHRSHGIASLHSHQETGTAGLMSETFRSALGVKLKACCGKKHHNLASSGVCVTALFGSPLGRR